MSKYRMKDGSTVDSVTKILDRLAERTSTLDELVGGDTVEPVHIGYGRSPKALCGRTGPARWKTWSDVPKGFPVCGRCLKLNGGRR